MQLGLLSSPGLERHIAIAPFAIDHVSGKVPGKKFGFVCDSRYLQRRVSARGGVSLELTLSILDRRKDLQPTGTCRRSCGRQIDAGPPA
jgi:hypothetical protein